MKWTNKGHEFDEVFNNIKNKSKYYIFGAGQYGQAIYNLLKDKLNIIGFIDNDKIKQQQGYNGRRVYSVREVNPEDNEVAVIIAVSPNTRKNILIQLQQCKFVLDKNLFMMEKFMSVYEIYENGRVYFPSISFLPSTRCNLNCEACLNFTPYMDHFDERDWEQIKADVDTFFSSIDYIMLFHISGGEPLLYPKIGELIEYIDNNYRDKIYFFRTVTNGTVVPKDELLERISKHDIEITVDDYREAVPESKDKFDRLLEKLEKYNIKYEINKVDTWIDLAPFTTDHSDWSEQRLGKHFDGCHVPWQELREKKIYSCNYASYAIVAGIIDETEDEVFDLTKLDENNKKELIEFRMGYNNKGYVDFCKRCSGYMDLNPNIVQPAKQKERCTKKCSSCGAY